MIILVSFYIYPALDTGTKKSSQLPCPEFLVKTDQFTPSPKLLLFPPVPASKISAAEHLPCSINEGTLPLLEEDYGKQLYNEALNLERMDMRSKESCVLMTDTFTSLQTFFFIFSINKMIMMCHLLTSL